METPNHPSLLCSSEIRRNLCPRPLSCSPRSKSLSWSGAQVCPSAAMDHWWQKVCGEQDREAQTQKHTRPAKLTRHGLKLILGWKRMMLVEWSTQDCREKGSQTADNSRVWQDLKRHPWGFGPPELSWMPRVHQLWIPSPYAKHPLNGPK